MNLIKAVTEPIEAVADVTAEAVRAETKPVAEGLREVADGLREFTEPKS
jgi:hypothetical protein